MFLYLNIFFKKCFLNVIGSTDLFVFLYVICLHFNIRKTNNKRAHKNKKFGFGGRKRNMKANTSDSHNMSKFNSSVHGNKKVSI